MKRVSVPRSTSADHASVPRSAQAKHASVPRSALRAVVIGAAPDPRGSELITSEDFVAVCDGGLEYALREGIRYKLLVGDFDSYTKPLPDLSPDVELIRLPAEKDDTDIGFAVKTLLRRGFRDFLIIGGIGGRLDHTLGNFSVASGIAARGGLCTLTGSSAGETIYVFRGRTLELTPLHGAYVSIFPWGCPRATVTARGFKYPLEHGTVNARTTLGVSNEFALSPVDPSLSASASDPLKASITAESGTIAVIVNQTANIPAIYSVPRCLIPSNQIKISHGGNPVQPGVFPFG